MTDDEPFRIGLTDDSVYEKSISVPTTLKMLQEASGAVFERFPVDIDPVPSETLNRYDAVLAGGSHFTPESMSAVDRCSLIVRFGAGYDRVDLKASTEAGIIVATTPVGVRRPMATAALTHILVLSTRYMEKVRCTQENRWSDASQPELLGMGLGGRTLGFVGFGSIGRDLYDLISPFNMRHLVYDPYLDKSAANKLNITLADLDTVLTESDVVVVVCALTEETFHLIGTREFGLMKRDAYFVNVARGGIVDQKALASALAEHEIKAAGLDALDPEPIAEDDPLLKLDNAIITPHAMGLTDEMVRLCSELCVKAALDVQAGRPPDSVINLEVLKTPKLKAKLEAYRQKHSS